MLRGLAAEDLTKGLVDCLRHRVNGVMADQEESLLQQLMEITRVMQEGQLVEGMVSERKAKNDWEGESRIYKNKENSAVYYLNLVPKFRGSETYLVVTVAKVTVS